MKGFAWEGTLETTGWPSAVLGAMTQAQVTCSQAHPSSEGLRASLFSLRVTVCPLLLLQQCWDHGRMGGAASRSLYGANPRLDLWV